MSRARDRADGQDLTAYAPLASPDFTGTVDLTGTTVSLDDDEISLDKVSGGTLGAGTFGSSVVFPAGHVLQVVNSPNFARRAYAATSHAAISGTDQAGAGSEWCCKITPLFSTSKILVMPTLNIGGHNATLWSIFIYRDSTQIFRGDANASETSQIRHTFRSQTYNQEILPVSGVFLDTPSIPSTPIEIKYSPQWRSDSAARNVTLNYEVSNTNNDNFGTTYSNILIMEIAG